MGKVQRKSLKHILKSRVQQQWNESFDRLVEFQQTHGHWKVPPSYEKDTSFASWIQTQRTNRQSLASDQVERLDAISFPWNDDDDASGENSSLYETANEYETGDETVDDMESSAAAPAEGKTKQQQDPRYPIGTKVKQFVQGQGWLSGKVSAANASHNYSVRFDDGDTAEYNEEELSQVVLSPALAKVEVGSRISILWPDDGVFYDATVTREKQHKKRPYSVLYDTGEHEWLDLSQSTFRLLESEHGRSASSVTSKRFAVGTKVKKYYKGFGWYIGEVVSLDGSVYTILFEDGDTEVHTDKSLARIVVTSDLAKLDIDTKVEVHWPNNGRYYKGTVKMEQNNKENLFCIVYDTGEFEWLDLRVRKFRLVGEGTRVLASPTKRRSKLKVEVGSRVAIEWDDGVFYGASITGQQKNQKHLFFLLFDNGDREWKDFDDECNFRLLRKVE